MSFRALCLLLLALPAASLAQPVTLSSQALSRGINLPPVNPATVEDASAVSSNPAALGSAGGPQLLYLHERSLARGQVADALFLGSSWGRAVGTGIGLEWIRSPALADYRKSSFTLSLGPPSFSVGTTYHSYTSTQSADLDSLSSFDLGLSARLLRPVSLAAVLRNVNAPGLGEVHFSRELELSLGARPLGERLTLGATYLSQLDDLGDGRFGYVLSAQVVRGLVLGAGVSHGLRARELAFQLSLTVNAERTGLTYAAGGSSGGMDHLVGLRLSADRLPALASSPKLALFDLNDLLAPKDNLLVSLVGAGSENPYLRLFRLLDQARRDPQLAGIILKVDTLPDFGLGKAEELRRSVLSLRASGKKVIALVLSAGDAEYLAASAADQIFAVPEASLLVNGFSANVAFLGGTMQKLGVSWDVARVGAYKNAPDQLTRTDMSPEQREAVEAYLDASVRGFETGATQARPGLTREKLREAQGQGLVSSRGARELGLLDQVVNPSELDVKIRELVPGARMEARYRPQPFRKTRWGMARKIAVVPVIGTIAGGKSRRDPLGATEIAGAETVVRAIERAGEDPQVAAIVLRIDSGGGDGLASDLMYRAVLEAKKKKPVVASMGDVAASGGYYAAMGADEVFALPTTLTGSIGVFMLKPSVAGLAEKLGVTHQSLSRGGMPDILSTWRPWTEAEAKAAQAWVDGFYDDFITEVSASRKLSKEAVDQVARGRIWAGEDALRRGLVDTLGGLEEAVASARKRAGLAPGETVELEVLGEPAGLLATLAGEEGVSTLVGERPPLVPEAFLRLARELGLTSTTLLEPGVKALLPYQIQVR